nr:hypothetical protein [Tanacetum cinerariifolium]
MKRRPEECYDLIENMNAHHNNWDTSAHRGESSCSITSSSSEIAALRQQMAEMIKDMLQMCRLNQQVNSVSPSCETCGALKAEMVKINKNLMRVLQVNQQVKAVTPNCETCGGPHPFNDCPTTVGNTQNVYDARAYQ